MNIEEMIKLYDAGVKTSIIANLAGYKTSKSIIDKLKKANHKIRTNSEASSFLKGYDDNLFKTIDSDWKAYYLGLLLTDGWITHRKTNNPDIVGLSSTDLDVIQFISEKTGKAIQVVNKPARKIGPKGNLINQATEYRIILNSAPMVKDLQRLGVVEKKTKSLKGPVLTAEEEAYLPSLLRGIIDGDGTLGFPSTSKGTMYFRIVSASEDFILWCKSALEKIGMIKLNNPRLNTLGVWEITSAVKENLAILTHVIYKDEFGMKRKRNKIRNHFFEYTIGRLTK